MKGRQAGRWGFTGGTRGGCVRSAPRCHLQNCEFAEPKAYRLEAPNCHNERETKYIYIYTHVRAMEVRNGQRPERALRKSNSFTNESSYYYEY